MHYLLINSHKSVHDLLVQCPKCSRYLFCPKFSILLSRVYMVILFSIFKFFSLTTANHIFILISIHIWIYYFENLSKFLKIVQLPLSLLHYGLLVYTLIRDSNHLHIIYLIRIPLNWCCDWLLFSSAIFFRFVPHLFMFRFAFTGWWLKFHCSHFQWMRCIFRKKLHHIKALTLIQIKRDNILN